MSAARAALLAAVAAVFSGCAQDPQPVREELLVFGSPATIEVLAADRAHGRAAIAAVARRLELREREWHPWRDSALTRINAALADGRAAPAPASVLRLLEHSRGLHRASDGLFDPAIGSLVALWGFHTGDFPITSAAPDSAAIDRWLESRPTLDALWVESGRVGSDRRDIALDFNAIAEGAACAEAHRVLAANGIVHALVTLGGDLCARGRARGRPWRAALRDPFGEVLGVVELADGEALFSSGDYHKYRPQPDGARWPHVLDPRTGMPARGAAAVVVLGRDPVLADAAATTLLVGGSERFASLTDAMGVRCAFLLTTEDRLLITRSLHRRIRWHRQPRLLAAPIAASGSC
ncbi:MAG TPA: FAD:protein FMN transferase [Xanthomonadaceae bacterium]|nr:FAD:protein FMN transferase [Xanthomonadaceae bacterium]